MANRMGCKKPGDARARSSQESPSEIFSKEEHSLGLVRQDWSEDELKVLSGWR